MKVKRFLLLATVCTILFNKQAFSMEEKEQEVYTSSHGVAQQNTVSESNIPFEVKVHILSFLDQTALLRAGGVSREWRSAAEEGWKKKSLRIVYKTLDSEKCQTLANGPFYSLFLYQSEVGNEEVNALATSSRWKEMVFTKNMLTANSMQAVASWSDLTLLNLSHNWVGDEGITTLAAAALPKLKHLDVTNCRIKNVGVRALLGASFMTQLEVLILRSNGFGEGARRVEGEEGATTALAGVSFSQLKHLDLGKTSVVDQDVQVLVPALPSTLQSLYLDKSYGTLSMLGELPFRLTYRSVETLARANFPNLTTLNLFDNNIRDRGGIALFHALPKFPKLTYLTVKGNSISDAGIEALTAAIRRTGTGEN